MLHNYSKLDTVERNGQSGMSKEDEQMGCTRVKRHAAAKTNGDSHFIILKR